ncbi:heparinase II/III family protein [Lysobacter sp. CA199]|uniref:heparinase II/III family protein n=1 Tax=Lysobacter sp. CA199 TaxID=3455608 RepID=UPI003F8D11F7
MWHTVRYLRPVQIYGRAWHRLHRPRIEHAPAPPLTPTDGRWSACARPASMLGAHRFRFLNEERELASNDWNNSALPKLWLYNLHYFDDLNANGALSRTHWHRDLIARWIADNPPAAGNGWEPYCLSLRIVNWIKWRNSGQSFGDESRERSALNSLATQVRYLRGRLERHLLGNHLWANYKALLFAGAFFQGPQAKRWLDLGLNGLRHEIGEQILADGGHFERSPMYHAILLEDLLDLLQLARLYPEAVSPDDVALWRDRAEAMLGWLSVMTHPDGGIAFFNDAALGIAPNLAELSAYARSLGIEPTPPSDQSLQVLPQSGYARLQCGDAVLIADVGDIGPDYLPGHAHADTLSFELSLCGRRVLVNAGTSRYDISPQRLWQRGTAAHNTIEIDGCDSSEVWSSFRVAQRARPLDVEHGRFGDGAWLAAGHDGYRRLKGRAVHHRRWVLQPGALRIEDRIDGGFVKAVSRFRIHPDARVEDHTIQLEGAPDLRWRIEPATERTTPSTYHPGFGVTHACTVIEAAIDPSAGQAVTLFLWDC